jgi:hypothetical protein
MLQLQLTKQAIFVVLLKMCNFSLLLFFWSYVMLAYGAEEIQSDCAKQVILKESFFGLTRRWCDNVA